MDRSPSDRADQDFYTTGQAAKILGITDRGVRKMIDRGELEDAPDDRGHHQIPQREVHRLLQERREAAPEETTETPQASQEAAELRARVEGLQRDLGRLEGRLELTAQAESTLREQLDRERELADMDREYLQGQLEEAQAERRQVAEDLEAVRRPWWRRIFG